MPTVTSGPQSGRPSLDGSGPFIPLRVKPAGLVPRYAGARRQVCRVQGSVSESQLGTRSAPRPLRPSRGKGREEPQAALEGLSVDLGVSTFFYHCCPKELFRQFSSAPHHESLLTHIYCSWMWPFGGSQTTGASKSLSWPREPICASSESTSLQRGFLSLLHTTATGGAYSLPLTVGCLAASLAPTYWTPEAPLADTARLCRVLLEGHPSLGNHCCGQPRATGQPLTGPLS